MSLAQGDVVQLSGRTPTSAASDTSNESAEHVVRGYLEAFKALDAPKMVSFWAEGAQVRRNGTLEPVNRDQTDMRGFERSTHTTWTYRIESVIGASVTVVLTEENDFYRALGVGKRTQVVTYVVDSGKIVEIRPISMRDEHGVYQDEYRRFLDWLQQQPSGNDPGIVRNGDFVFTYESGLKLQPWLERYRPHR
jgi:limonene-1,2-epoxide hydrolase